MSLGLALACIWESASRTHAGGVRRGYGRRNRLVHMEMAWYDMRFVGRLNSDKKICDERSSGHLTLTHSRTAPVCETNTCHGSLFDLCVRCKLCVMAMRMGAGAGLGLRAAGV